jgi:hypothetical protein
MRDGATKPHLGADPTSVRFRTHRHEVEFSGKVKFTLAYIVPATSYHASLRIPVRASGLTLTKVNETVACRHNNLPIPCKTRVVIVKTLGTRGKHALATQTRYFRTYII